MASTGLYTIETESGSPMIVEVSTSEIPGGVQLAATPGESIGKAADTLETILGRVQPVIESVLSSLSEAAGPSEIQIEFGLTFGGETGIIFAKGKVEGTFAVKVTWDRRGS